MDQNYLTVCMLRVGKNVHHLRESQGRENDLIISKFYFTQLSVNSKSAWTNPSKKNQRVIRDMRCNSYSDKGFRGKYDNFEM